MNFSDVLNSPTPVLVNYCADWCEPCQWAKPILDEVIKTFDGKITLYKIDIDRQPELSRQQHIMSVPTLVLMKQGKEVWRMRGFDTAPKLVKILGEYV